MKHLYFLFSVIVLSLCVLTVRAQIDSTLQSVHELQRIDVIASHRLNSVRSTTPVQQIDWLHMQQLGIHTMSDALKHMAGVTLRDYGGAGGMKTVSVRGIGARHTAVVYDGLALSDCQTGEIDLSRYSLDQLSSLALFIGDGDDIFQPARNQAAAATLYLEQSNKVTKYQSHKVSEGQCNLNVGSFGLVSPSFRLSKSIGRRLTLMAVSEYFHADNDYPFTLQNLTLTTHERRTNSRMNSGHGELNLHWQVGQGSSLTAKAYYYDSHRRLPGIVHYYTNENHERLCEQVAFGQMSLRSELSAQWSLLLNAKYNWSSTDYQNRTAGSGIGDARYWQREAYGSASVLYAPTRWLSFDYALDAIENSLNSTLAIYQSHPHRTTLLQALSAKAQWPHLTVVARLLYHHSQSDGQCKQRLAPSASLSYSLLPKGQLFVRLMAKHIFRMPTFNELYYYHIGSASLKPECASQINLGLTGQIENENIKMKNVAFTADLYINKVSDKIVAVPFNMFVWRIMNLDRATIAGVDFTATGSRHLGSRHTLAFHGNYSWQRAMNETIKASPLYHHQLPYIPEHTFCASLSWENPWVNAIVTTTGQSCRWTTVEHSAGTRMSGFTTTDLSLFRSFSSKTVRFTLQNVFNRQYDLVAHYPMPGRSFLFQFIIKN